MKSKVFATIAAAAAIAIGAAGWAQQGGQGQQPMGPTGHGDMGHGQPAPGTGPGMMMRPGMMGPSGRMGPGMMGGGMMGAGSTSDRPWITIMLDHREQLGLSPEQIGRLVILRDSFAKEAREKNEALEKVERELDQMLGPGPVELSAVEAKLKQAEAMRTDLRLSRIKVIEDGKAVLTPEQRRKFVELATRPQRSSGDPSHRRPMPMTRGMEEMHRFMQSEAGAASMDAMMQMARRMGDGNAMLGMVRMMQMMGDMGSMGGTMPGPPGPAK